MSFNPIYLNAQIQIFSKKYGYNQIDQCEQYSHRNPCSSINQHKKENHYHHANESCQWPQISSIIISPNQNSKK